MFRPKKKEKAFRTVDILTVVALFSHRCRIALLAFAHLTFALLSYSHCFLFRTVDICTVGFALVLFARLSIALLSSKHHKRERGGSAGTEQLDFSPGQRFTCIHVRPTATGAAAAACRDRRGQICFFFFSVLTSTGTIFLACLNKMHKKLCLEFERTRLATVDPILFTQNFEQLLTKNLW